MLPFFSNGCVPLSDEMIQTFISEESVPLLVLTLLVCCSFPLILIIGYGSTKRYPRASSVFQTYFSLHHYVATTYFHLNSINYPIQFCNFPLPVGSLSCPKSQVVSSLMELMCPLVEYFSFGNWYPQTSKAQSWEIGNKKFTSGTLSITTKGGTAISSPWFWDLWILVLSHTQSIYCKLEDISQPHPVEPQKAILGFQFQFRDIKRWKECHPCNKKNKLGI